jgi:hypothetical protein
MLQNLAAYTFSQHVSALSTHPTIPQIDCAVHTFVINLISFVTSFPVFRLPSSPGLSLTVSIFSTFPSSTPTSPASFAKRPYVWFRVSLTTLTSKKLF